VAWSNVRRITMIRSSESRVLRFGRARPRRLIRLHMTRRLPDDDGCWVSRVVPFCAHSHA
jgi:hypothetical protein